ncbi:hypothetical protein ACFYYN_32760 [Streptomyces sp. NPDC001902]|nr:hypothetical protein [Streptomyces sp. PA03-5A]
MTGQHRLTTDQGPGAAAIHHESNGGHHRMHHLLRTARVYAQTVFDVVVLGTGTDDIHTKPERTAPPPPAPDAATPMVRADGSGASGAYR